MKQKLLCYSKYEFNAIMRNSKIYSPEDLPENVVVISIGAPWNEEEPSHWFANNAPNVINVDFDDCGPMWPNGEDNYDIAQEMLDHQDRFFKFSYFNEHINKLINVAPMNFIQSNRIVKFIEENKDKNFMVHCNAGASRSQGVVRYILDTYGENNFETRDSNPCLTPNMHVVRMLKRSYRKLYMS